MSGHILPVGGIKEKVLAAKRSGVCNVVLPEQNRADVDEEIPQELRQGIEIQFANTIEDALSVAFAETSGGLRSESPKVAGRES